VTDEDRERLLQLYVDFYFGKDQDNPPMTLRMDRVERKTADILSAISQLKWICIATAVTVAGAFIGNVIWSHWK
jgi:hypothetical protein